jgi:hypothetical protein
MKNLVLYIFVFFCFKSDPNMHQSSDTLSSSRILPLHPNLFVHLILLHISCCIYRRAVPDISCMLKCSMYSLQPCPRAFPFLGCSHNRNDRKRLLHTFSLSACRYSYSWWSCMLNTNRAQWYLCAYRYHVSS